MFATRFAVFAFKPQNIKSALAVKSVGSIPISGTFTRAYRGKMNARSFKAMENTTISSVSGVGAIGIGRMAVAGGGVVGLGALCFYGMGLSNNIGTIDKMYLWSPVVKQRIKDTYMYFAASVAATGASAVYFYRSPMFAAFRNFSQNRPIVSIVLSLAALIGTSSAMQSVPYQAGSFGTKQLLWLANCGVIGIILSPVASFGGAIAIRAAWITAGMITGLSTVAICAPSEKFLKWGAPLGLGLGGIVVASVGSAFLAPTSALAVPLYSISVYGGLLIFSGLLLYDTQKIMISAETHPEGYGYMAYDPINASHRIVMDAVNIFIRIAQILSGSKRK